jgi:hypothetical protein
MNFKKEKKITIWLTWTLVQYKREGQGGVGCDVPLGAALFYIGLCL